MVEELNADPEVDGILVQLPLPPHIDQRKVLLAVDVEKDGTRVLTRHTPCPSWPLTLAARCLVRCACS